MLYFLSFSLLAATAYSEITTSIWMPNGYDSAQQIGFYGSVVGGDKERMTLAIVYDNDTNVEGASLFAETITVASTLLEAQTTSTDSKTPGDYTYSLHCDMPTTTSADAVCTYSLGGELAHAIACADITQALEAETTVGNNILPDWCTEGSTLPSDIAEDTFTLGPSEVDTYKVVITAGEEKLGATAGASITSSVPQSTGLSSEPEKSSVPTSTAPTTSTATTGSAPAPEEATGGAAPLRTIAPAIAGFGAAAAMLIL